ncbi:bifunctional protein-serine/threonine kinase/phosphatase [Shewanella sp. 1_MG-2023]|uniref:bifunctional protein-serine/threonine kinase/phosphatase n=1 Tax=unclassified Shewanella TaxID=196818 RepID=UPI0026E2C523|nr:MULTISPECIES: bifunctional protein-serine/threonine kinase/phosphatase [unclassified Shewanella]MDO6612000.1 bifunctional protein-serine/threonine kinase/phosphatase [Shewanella sp. 7_MG-2023]MDO6771924.1 bifunctional protein-serine/threonine kinase/phosphatase [Shewanella sp. 2_MG-2023]MDO6794268.1 bifunctional protein-serine/threonine kinase/phosphatase [Shewanella sp. 1_MG-2023]
MSKTLKLTIGQHSVSGVKPVNQDCCGSRQPKSPQLNSKGAVVAIADGISSSDVSDIASETAISNFLHDYYATSDAWSVKTSAHKVLQALNHWLFAQGQQGLNRHDANKGYVCTFSALVLKSNTAHLFHCGDSRIYQLSGQSFEQLTKDHRRYVGDTSYLSQALGISPLLSCDYHAHPVKQGDIFVLTTDGVHEFLSAKVIADAIIQEVELGQKRASAVTTPVDKKAIDAKGADFDRVAQDLVAQALAAGGDDNLTIQIVSVDELPSHEVNEFKQLLTQLPLPPALHSEQEFEGFTIQRELYVSSRSRVYLAQDKASGQRVVIKVPSDEMRHNEGHLETLLMEDWVAQRVSNTHLLKSFVSTSPKQYLYTVTEYVEGCTLAQWIHDHAQPDLDTVRNLVIQIARGLQALHRQEMVHQDLRPENIMIDTAGVIKIIDFGAAAVAGIIETQGVDDHMLGTAQYSGPEYFIGELGDNRSDIFSLAVITYQMLTGYLPYDANVAKATTLKAQQSLRYIPARSRNAVVPHWVDYALEKALAVDPAKRTAEVSEFIYNLKYPHPKATRENVPFIDKDPILFWQRLSLLLGLGLVIALLN